MHLPTPPRPALLAALLAACTPAAAAPPPGYYAAAEGRSGQALRAALRAIIGGHQAIPYASTPGPLADLWADPARPGNLRLTYSGASVPVGSTWNREHLWPRSRGNVDQAGPDHSDLFHLVPAPVEVNAERSALPFDVSDPADPGYRFPGHPDAPATSRDSNSWEPAPEERGDIARALFYMATRYDGTEPDTTALELVTTPPLGPQMGNLDVLLRWHEEDPPDDAERRRNDRIHAAYQGNRNPFIDEPAFARRIWGEPSASRRLATWTFETPVAAGGTVAATTGTGELVLSGWRGTLAAFNGTTGNALVLVGQAGNGSWIDFRLSLAGFTDLRLDFHVRGTSSGFDDGTWSASVDGVNFVALAGVDTATRAAAFETRTVDFSGMPALADAPAVTVRYTLAGATSDSGNNRLDEVTFTAMPGDEDRDGDGVPRLLERVLGRDPARADAGPALVPSFESLPPPSGGTPRPSPVVTLVRRRDAASVRLRLESAAAPTAAWAADLVPIAEVPQPADPALERLRWRLPDPAGPTRIVRLRVGGP